MEEKADLDALYRFTALEIIFRLDALRDGCKLVRGKFAGELRAGDEAPQEHGEQHKVIVLNPHHGVFANLLADDLGEAHVGYAVREPILLVEIHFSGMIVEEGPEDGV